MRTWASTLLGWWGERLLEIPCGAVEFPEQVPGFVQWELVTWDKLPSSINLYRGQCPPPCRGAIWWRAWYSACHLLTGKRSLLFELLGGKDLLWFYGNWFHKEWRGGVLRAQPRRLSPAPLPSQLQLWQTSHQEREPSWKALGGHLLGGPT